MLRAVGREGTEQREIAPLAGTFRKGKCLSWAMRLSARGTLGQRQSFQVRISKCRNLLAESKEARTREEGSVAGASVCSSWQGEAMLGPAQRS